MLDASVVWLLAGKELRDARRNRWFTLYTFAFAALSLALSWLGLSAVRDYGLSGFGRTSASLVNLVLLIVPLMGISLGALSLAFERERGTLLYVMAQPVTILEVLAGKFLGLSVALLAALTMGFGLSGLLIAWQGGIAQAGVYLLLLGLAFLLAVASLAIGLLVSASVRRTAAAVGFAIFAWSLLVFFGDLGVMGTSLVLKLGANQLFLLSLANPLNVFKMAAILAVHGNLELLGPAGQYALRTYGAHLVPLLLAILAGWTVLTMTLTYFLFRRRGAM